MPEDIQFVPGAGSASVQTADAVGIVRALDFSRPLIMGILNVTPDSFSDGGNYLSIQSAIQHAETMVEQGADIIDIGGESTRPGASPVSIQEQKERLLPVISALRTQLSVRVRLSVDTRSSDVAAAALAAGADIINDVGAGTGDAAIFDVAAQSGAPLVIMHMQGTPENMQNRPYYENVVEDVSDFLLERASAAQAAGVRRSQIILDPGIGFGKRRNDNLRLLAHLEALVRKGFPVLLGTSRKRFMGSICRTSTPQKLRYATTATTALGVMAGVSVFRVHDVEENRQAADVAKAIRDARTES